MVSVPSSSAGFTLVEVMVSILILMVGLMGLLQVINLSIEHNMRNQLRVEAIGLADAEMAREMSKGFSNVSTTTATFVRNRLIMNAIQKNYSVMRTGTPVSNSKSVSYKVTWGYKQARYQVNVSSIISAPPQ